MPELPEVETTRRGLIPLIQGARILKLRVHETRMRWPFEPAWVPDLEGRQICTLERRAKHLLLDLEGGRLLVHLGMSGSLRCSPPQEQRRKHDHIEFELDNGLVLRFHDPRRFGCVLWLDQAQHGHPLLENLGPEPLSEHFDGNWLHRLSRGRKQAVKAFIMDQKTVVGVGNIYASEALFMAGIHPARPAGRISLARYEKLSDATKTVLHRAIEQGGSTLRDFLGGDGKPGYFQQTLLVYGRNQQPCPQCGQPLKEQRIGQRASVYCSRCQR